MKIGLRMPGMSRALGVSGVIEWAAEAGLDAIDLPEPNSDWARLATERGLTLGSIDSAGRKDLLSPDPERQKTGIEAACLRIAAAAALGATAIFEVLSPPDPAQPRSESFAIWKETYPAVCAAAEASGIRIAIEPYPGGAPHYGNLGTNPDQLRRMFAALDSPALGLCYDPSHFVRLGIDELRIIEEFGDRIHYVHAKDCALSAEGAYTYGSLGESFGRRYRHGGGPWRYCIPGHGDVRWENVVFLLAASGYDGILSIELEDHRYAPEPDRQQRGILSAADYMRRLI